MACCQCKGSDMLWLLGVVSLCSTTLAYSLGEINRRCQVPTVNLNHGCVITLGRLSCTGFDTPAFTSCDKQADGSGDVTFQFLWNFDGSLSFSPAINAITSLSADLFNSANAPEPFDSAINSGSIECTQTAKVCNEVDASCSSCSGSQCADCTIPACGTQQFRHCSPASTTVSLTTGPVTSAFPPVTTCQMYAKCAYCQLIPCPNLGCTSSTCDGCTCTNLSILRGLCSNSPCDICRKANCYLCTRDSSCASKTYKKQECIDVCQDPAKIYKYGVAYVVHIKNLPRLQRIDQGVFDALRLYITEVIIENTANLARLSPFGLNTVHPRLRLIKFHTLTDCKLQDLSFLSNLQTGAEYIDISITCFPAHNLLTSQSILRGLRRLGNKMRKLTLVGVTINFQLDFCSFPSYWVNGVPGKELHIVDDRLVINCGCLTAFFRKYGRNTPESYGDAARIIKFTGGQSKADLMCTNINQPLLTHDFICENENAEFSNIVFHGIDEDLDLTHNCTIDGRLCPLGCNCDVPYVSCEKGPTLESEVNVLHLVLQGTDYAHLQDIQANSLINVTNSDLAGVISTKQLSLVIVHLQQLARIDVDAFAGYEEQFFQVHMNRLPLIDNLPRNLLKKFVNMGFLAVTHTAVADLSFMEELENNLLTELYLNDNELTNIGRTAFAGLPFLQRVHLHNNKLTHLDFCELRTFLWTELEKEVLGGVTITSRSASGKVMTLGGNQLTCSCSMAYFRRFIHPNFTSNSKNTFKLQWDQITGVDDPTCTMDDGTTHDLDSFPILDEDCANPFKLACNCIVPAGESACGCGYCTNSGTCQQDKGYCVCLEEYTGPSCETLIYSLPVCGLEESLRCYYDGQCNFLICDCKTGWVGSQCDFAEVCDPSPCDLWQVCKGLGSFVDWKLLNAELQDLLKVEYQCFDKKLIEEQIFGTVQLSCDENNDICSRLDGSSCIKKEGNHSYCGCPVDKPLGAQFSCSRIPVRCTENADCLRLGLRYICSYDSILDAEHGTTSVKYCICGNPNARDSIDGRCLIDELVPIPPATYPPFVWETWYTYLLIGVSLFLVFLLALCVASCGVESSKSEEIQRVERLIGQPGPLPDDGAGSAAYQGPVRQGADASGPVGEEVMPATSRGSQGSRARQAESELSLGSRASHGSYARKVSRRKPSTVTKLSTPLMQSAIASSMAPFSQTPEADELYKKKILTPNGLFYSPLLGKVDPNKGHRKKKKK